MVILLWILLATSLVSANLPKEKSPRNGSNAPVTAEQLQVYGGLLDSISSLHVKKLANETAPFKPSDVQEKVCLKGIELEDYHGSAAHSFTPDITKGRDLTLVDSIQQAKILDQEDRSETAQAPNGKQDAPKALLPSSFLVFSEIAFDRTHQYAVLKYVLLCGSHCKTSQTFVMERTGAQWKVRGRPCTMSID